ncbi:hypothetical protein D5086_018862 [Populus alba]|uniref:Uncharacterized protein n=1 Tax=Populus alba TaxID=43335 RepID=A0ACC4BRG4_POPAL
MDNCVSRDTSPEAILLVNGNLDSGQTSVEDMSRLLTTLFWCSMSKDRKSQASFDVFWPSGDAKKHGGIDHLSTWTVNEKAVWVVRDDGIYLKIRDPGGDAFKNDYIDEILYLRWQPKRTTLFWCNMSKDKKSHASLDVFWSFSNAGKHGGFDLSAWAVNEEALWIVRDDGIYLWMKAPGWPEEEPYVIETLSRRWEPKR